MSAKTRHSPAHTRRVVLEELPTNVNIQQAESQHNNDAPLQQTLVPRASSTPVLRRSTRKQQVIRSADTSLSIQSEGTLADHMLMHTEELSAAIAAERQRTQAAGDGAVGWQRIAKVLVPGG